MVEKDFLKDRIYCMSNDSGDINASDCITTFSTFEDPFLYPAPIEEAATECGLNFYVFPNGRGFAVNFGAVVSVHEIYLEPDDSIDTLHVKVINLPEHIPEYNPLDVSMAVEPKDGDACLIMTDGRKVFLPITPKEVEKLRRGSVDKRPVLRITGPRPNYDRR